MQILLRLSRPSQQLLFAPPLARGNQAHRQFPLALQWVDITHRSVDGRRARHVGQEDVRHVPQGGVGVAHAVGVVSVSAWPSDQGGCRRHDQQAWVLLEQKGQVAHHQRAQAVHLEVVGGRRLRAHGKEDLVGSPNEREVVGRVGRPLASLFSHLGNAEAAVGDLHLREVRDADVDNLVAALGGEVVERLVAQLAHGRVGLVEPVAVDAHDAPRRWRRRNRQRKEALGRAVGIGLRHDAVGNGEVGGVCRHRASHAHGHLHDVGAVVSRLEAVDAVEVGRDADAAAGVCGHADGDDAGRDGRAGAVG